MNELYCEHLRLVNFRNFARLDLDLSSGLTVVLGDNAQGKSNLLEALYYLSTTKSFRASTERELINWQAAEENLPFARIDAKIQTKQQALRLEIVIKDESLVGGATNGGGLSKRIRLNEVPKKAFDIIGRVNIVLFSPQDIELVEGPPVLRRRFMDVTISQVDSRYCRLLAHYNRVVAQRNHLLRQIREGQAEINQLEFWDKELVDAGSYVVTQRYQTVKTIDRLAKAIHRQLASDREQLGVSYRASVIGGSGESATQALPDLVDGAHPGEQATSVIRRFFRDRLNACRARDIQMGISSIGPHRDDLLLTINERNAATLGSRGQQRTAALALKLAEADFMYEKSSVYPVLLLDDVMSELDRGRRRQVLEMTKKSDQVLVTASDAYVFEAEALSQATVLSVAAGVIDTR